MFTEKPRSLSLISLISFLVILLSSITGATSSMTSGSGVIIGSSISGITSGSGTIIGITLVNEGYLNYEKNNLVTWIGDIYNRADDVVDKLWRDKKTWAPYTKKQLNSLYKLCEYLSIEFDITMAFVGHNTELSNPESYDGILCRSNFSKYYYDVSPAFDFKYFNNKFNKTDNQ